MSQKPAPARAGGGRPRRFRLQIPPWGQRESACVQLRPPFEDALRALPPARPVPIVGALRGQLRGTCTLPVLLRCQAEGELGCHRPVSGGSRAWVLLTIRRLLRRKRPTPSPLLTTCSGNRERSTLRLAVEFDGSVDRGAPLRCTE